MAAAWWIMIRAVFSPSIALSSFLLALVAGALIKFKVFGGGQ